MKLSDAILTGCKYSYPLRNTYFDYQDGNLSACALGAANLAVGTPIGFVTFDEYLIWPEELSGVNVEFCKRVGLDSATVWSAIVYANDKLGMDRETIAQHLAECGL